jgi:hypothetical protein
VPDRPRTVARALLLIPSIGQPQLHHLDAPVVRPRDEHTLALPHRLDLTAREPEGGAFHEGRVRDGEADPPVGNLVEEGADARGHTLRRAAGRILARQPRDDRVVGRQLMARAAKDPCRRLGRTLGRRHEDDVVPLGVASTDVFGERASAFGERVAAAVARRVAPKLESFHVCLLLGGEGLAYHAASMRAGVVLAAAALVVCVACTHDGSPATSPSPTKMIDNPTTDAPGEIVAGEWTYSLYGVKATFAWKDGPATLTVKNGSEQPVGAPGLYVVTRDQRHVDGKVADAGPLDPSDSGDYTVTFPGGLQPTDIGLVVLELGDVNWGALGPKIQGS